MRNCLLLILSFFVSSVFAESISKEKALNIANHFFEINSRAKKKISLQCVEIEGRASTASSTFYIFNNVEDEGFVIVAGDDRIKPILGYSFKNYFPQNNLPCNVRMWLDDIDTQIAYISRNNILIPDNEKDNIGEVKIQLDTPQWDQGKPYNDLCPVMNGKVAPSGCVMTATAILMRFHQWPLKGIGVVPGYTTDAYGYKLSERKLGHIYDWEDMPYIYKSYTSKQAENVATLMFDLGMMLKADYTPNETGAYISDIPIALQTYMDYDSNASVYYRNNFSDNDWNELLKKELDNGRPVIYGGFNKQMSGGHAFVLDGYTTKNYYSVNWGWGGKYNGYFLLSALEPYGQGTGGNGSNYNYNQSAVLGLKKNERITERIEFVASENGLNGFQTSQTSFTANKPFTISSGKISNLSTEEFTGVFMLGLTDGTGVIKEELALHQVVDLKTSQGYSFVNVQCVITKPINRGDRIRAFYKSEQTKEWTLVKGNENCNYELLVADESTIEESTNIIYNKTEENLYIETKKGVHVKFTKEDGTDLSHLCNLSNEGVVIHTRGLENAGYIIRLSKGDEFQSVKIIMGNVKVE